MSSNPSSSPSGHRLPQGEKGAASDRAFVYDAVARIEADFNRSADTHLIKVDLPAHPGIELYLKDESSHPTGSLKHRLARSLFLYGLCNGWIGPNTTIVEASSGSTAVSEAYFARLLGLRFIAVMPRRTSPAKIEAIALYGGESHLVDDPKTVYAEAARLAATTGGHYVDQFTYAERATDWRGNNNIAESIFAQMAEEPHPVPRWVVVGAGTGGTSATIGRYIRYRRLDTRLCVADPEASVFHRAPCRPFRPGGGELRLLDRGHRPAKGGKILHPRPRRSHDRSARCCEPCRHAGHQREDRAALRRLHRHQYLGRLAHRAGDAPERRDGVDCHAALR